MDELVDQLFDIIEDELYRKQGVQCHQYERKVCRQRVKEWLEQVIEEKR